MPETAPPMRQTGGTFATLLKGAWPALVCLALLALVPVLSAALDNPFLIRLFTRVVIFAIVAVALNFVLGFGGLVSMMHAALFGVGAYVVAIFAFHEYDGSPLWIFPGSANLAITIPLAIIGTAFAAAITGVVSLRTSGAYFIMITLAFNQMLYYFFVALQTYGGEDGQQILASLHFAGIDITGRWTFYYVSLGVLALTMLLFWRLVNSRFGVVLRATAQNERRVIAVGISPLRYKLAAFVISGAVTGLAGALWATSQEFVSPADLSWIRAADFVVMAVLGGMSRVWGPVLGAVVIVLIEVLLPNYTQYWQLPFGIIVILIVVYLRGGLSGLFVRDRAVGGH
jgi:branched-chain amino acid transport system permease protein